MIDTFPEKLPIPKSEGGFMLIEVIISAMLIGLIVVATFTGFDVANRTTADERSHAQADAIAQQWEERMRGEQVSDIAALNKTFCVNDQGVEVAASAPCPASVVGSTGTIFTVATTGKFISNTSGASSCSKESTSADYIQTTTTVKWPALGSRLPVSESSIVTPPVSGQLVVQDYNGPNPVSGVEVTATGPAPAATSRTLTTGAEGCALFTTLPAGNYTVSVNQAGYVEKDGQQSYSASTTLTAGASSIVSIAYDRAGLIGTLFATIAAKEEKVTGDTFMAYNTTMSQPRGFGETGEYTASPATPLASKKTIFPFYYQEAPPPATYSYTLYAGSCTSNDPAGWGEPESDKTVDVAPGAESAAATLDLPSLKLALTNAAKEAVTTGAGAITELEEGLPAKIVTPVTGPGCKAKRTFPATPKGALPHPAMPFGRYELCVVANLGTKAAPKEYQYTHIVNNDKKVGAELNVNLSTEGKLVATGTKCP